MLYLIKQNKKKSEIHSKDLLRISDLKYELIQLFMYLFCITHKSS